MCEPKAYRDHEVAEEPLRAAAIAWLCANFPDNRNTAAYW